MIRNPGKLILLILCSLSISLVSAQHTNSFAGIRFGAALPMGEFASHEFGSGGYALLGTSFGGEAAWFINPKIGFGIDVSTNRIGFASGYYAEDYLETEPSYNSIEMLSGPYKLTTYMGGAYYKLAFNQKFSSTFKLMGGVMRAHTPDQFYGVDAFVVGKITFWKTSAYDTNIAFLTGASFEYRLDKRVSFLLQGDFTFSEMAFTFKKSGSTYTNYLQMPVFRLQPGINIHF